MLSWVNYPDPSVAVERVLLLMLPASGCTPADFAEHGMVAAAQAGGEAVDIIAVQMDVALYLEGGIVAALHRQIVEPALARGYRRIWLLGISLGGMGALLYAAAHAATLERVIVLAPFLGTRGTIAALEKAGGLAAGVPGAGITTAPERKLLTWLRDYAATGCRAPVLYLGYGEQDRFAPGHRMLAGLLPPKQVILVPGGHDWACWQALWVALLAAISGRHWTADA